MHINPEFSLFSQTTPNGSSLVVLSKMFLEASLRVNDLATLWCRYTKASTKHTRNLGKAHLFLLRAVSLQHYVTELQGTCSS
jgi:hypothetical protein